MGLIAGYKKLFGLFNRRQKINSLLMLVLIIIGGIAETIGVGVILPFTTILLDVESVQAYPFLANLVQNPWINGHRRFIIIMCTGLVIIFILKSLYMFFLIYIQNRFILNRQIDLSKMLFQSYIYKPYEFFFEKNTAELQRNVNTLIGQISQGVLMYGLQLLTELLVVILILILLLFVDPVSTISIGVVLGGFSALYYLLLKKRLDESAKKQNILGEKMVKTVNEALGSIKEVKVLGKESSFINGFDKDGRGYARTVAFYNVANQSPRLLIETVAVAGLVIIVVMNTLRSPDMTASLPTIALFGMAAMRIMPSLNRSIAFLTNIRFNMAHFAKIYDDLKDAKERADKVPAKTVKTELKNNIELYNLTYRYPNTGAYILKNAQLTVKKGQTIGIVGSSGAGKTTLVDILLGLLDPDDGDVLVDGESIKNNIDGFRRSVGYVPQDIFIIDDTVAANVAFGIPENEIKTERIWESLEVANLKDYIESLDEGLSTVVGESGTRLSGGQRQRLSIARTIYNNPDILIFDEATSSLDSESEKIISDAITAIGQSKTMIIIAHRLNTLEKCDIIYEIKDGKIMRQPN